MILVWAGLQLPARNNENAKCQEPHYSGVRCIKQLGLLWSHVQLIKYETQKPTHQICWIHDRFLFLLLNKTICLSWHLIISQRLLMTMWGNRYTFNFQLAYTGRKGVQFFFCFSIMCCTKLQLLSFNSSPLYLFLYFLCLVAKHFSSIIGHLEKNSIEMH